MKVADCKSWTAHSLADHKVTYWKTRRSEAKGKTAAPSTSTPGGGAAAAGDGPTGNKLAWVCKQAASFHHVCQHYCTDNQGTSTLRLRAVVCPTWEFLTLFCISILVCKGARC
jgi:hypothetical protein